MAPRYKITLEESERAALLALTKDGGTNSRRFTHARALLLCDAGDRGPAWNVAKVAEALGVTSRTIEHLKQRFLEEGLEEALQRKATVRAPTTFDGEFDTRLMALACSQAPEGRARWTVRLLAEKAVELNIARSVSIMTIQRSLKKMNCDLTEANIGRYHQNKTRPLQPTWKMCGLFTNFLMIR
jgi:transposase